LVVDLEADLDGEVEEAGFVRFLLLLDCGSHDDCCVYNGVSGWSRVEKSRVEQWAWTRY
jgi:hypothetical protein